MQLGVHIVSFKSADGPTSIAPTLARVARIVDDVGLTSVSVMDHYFQMDRMAPAEDPMLEGYTTLGFLAGQTTTVRLGLLVSGVTYRHPGLLAKIVATLDVLSGGRAELGIGAAWYEREHLGLGVPFPPLSERFERLEEALQICLQMWDPENVGAYDGRHYHLAETLCSPAPISRPRPPILIGGSGERKTLRLVAQYGDACNLFAAAAPDVGHKLDVLRRHCDDVGRDYDTIRTSILHGGGANGVDAFIEEMAEYARLGIDDVIVVPPGDRPEIWIEEWCAPAVVGLAELSPTG